MILYLRRALSSLRLFVGGNQQCGGSENRMLDSQRDRDAGSDAYEPVTRYRDGSLPARDRKKCPVPCYVNNVFHFAKLSARSSKRNGPLVLCFTGGKA